MRRVVKVKSGHKEYNAVEQQFEIAREEWNEYKLLDGGTVRTKTTVQRIYRVVDEEGHPQINAEGDPQMIVRHKTDVVASE